MNRLLWGASQGLTSALFFLLQLSFLKEGELKLMALFSTLFAFMNFFLLAIRRSLIETNSFKEEVPSLRLILKLSLIFGGISMPLLAIIHNRPIVLISVIIFLFNQLLLDFFRFSTIRNHQIFIAIQITTILTALLLKYFNLAALDAFVLIGLLQLIFSIFISTQDKRYKLNNFFPKAIFNFSRLLDFFLTSGFGFLLPLLVFIFLDSSSVGELRTSQNFLSLGNIFTASIYYSALNAKSSEEIHWTSYFIPSFVLLILLAIIELFAAPSMVHRFFGPFFNESIFLTLILITALVPITWNSRESAKLVKAKRFKSLLGVHSISLIVLATGSCIGFDIIGVASYGIFVIVSNIVEMTLIYRIKRNLNESNI